MKIGTISVVIFFCLIHFFTPAFGAVINVPAEYTTIQAAIDVSVDGDTILVADGTYEGAGNVNSDFAGKAITVKSVNGPANCIIDGKNQNRGFYFHSGEGNNSVISGFTIKNGFSPSKGGGILFINSSPSIINCIITEISFGYGLFCENSSPSLNNCVVRNNIEGGIYCENSSPVIMNCTISENAGIGICCKTSSPIIS
ncbi:MAG: right-handed parallel beta-helix repeat-containing protein [Desulfobacteraceae bacterium]|jgi:parallel beta-helix repeat protein|nr:right-handed parallel beta-helix repeat-containing protein [Desulfobacteraceae bacterium]